MIIKNPIQSWLFHLFHELFFVQVYMCIEKGMNEANFRIFLYIGASHSFDSFFPIGVHLTHHILLTRFLDFISKKFCIDYRKLNDIINNLCELFVIYTYFFLIFILQKHFPKAFRLFRYLTFT